MTLSVMLHKSKLTDSTTAQPNQEESTISDEQKTAFPATMVCNLADGRAFSQNYDGLHVPVLAAFGGDRLHQFSMAGAWDLERAVSENSAALFRSIRSFLPEQSLKEWDDLTFQFGPRSFLFADDTKIVGYAETPNEAERLVAKFNEAYSKPPAPTGGSFCLITVGRDISIETVTLGAETILSNETLSLHYGNEGHEWHQNFTQNLCARNHGLAILEGAPGTGKTSYLRHLMGVLKDSHRFYFIPPSTIDVLSNPSFTSFWANQRSRHTDRKFVVILEDADAALMTRGTDNRDKVSSILNLSDGMLADFLRLQIICTINCRSTDIDQALLRPGRLLSHRVFGRLNHAQASRLAESLGRNLPATQDYSLAEVFAGNGSNQISRPCIGFAS